ncbi:protein STRICTOSIDINE SYNTHASE-LIKE 12-like [Lotus japonicus]|uniref:protein STRICTOSIDINE SYNTHASE-LIKE 12-like n=1 Tax=Lotus japonicus TaxID=34305 RepID=UPI00258CD221|nr:protein STRICTOSIDINE SYNTHASE-LIKE 12-like [Lotus japonicus]
MMISVFATFIFLVCTPSAALLLNRLPLPSPLTGPEALAFDRNGSGPYVSSSDGRIFKYVGPNEGFQEYAYTSPNRNKTTCDGLADFSTLQATCGRPLGLGFNHQTGELYVADAYFGLLKIGANGGPPIQLVGPAQGNSSMFADGLDIDPDTGIVYFTEASAISRSSEDISTILTSGDSTGRLLKYDPSTNQTTVLLSDLAVPNGVAVSRDGSFVLVSEFMENRIQRFWLKGPRANLSDTFIRLAGKPDNIKRNSRGQFWVAVNSYLGPPRRPIRRVLPSGVRISENGLVLQVVSLGQEYGTEPASEVQEFNGTLYAGSLFVSYASIFIP